MNYFQILISREFRRFVYFGLSVFISVLLGGYLLSQIDVKALSKTFRNLHLPSLSIYISMAFLGVISRTYRYHLLISSNKIRFYHLMFVTLVRNLFVDLLPAKLGSLSYVYLINRRFGFPLEIAASSFLLAFIFDVIVLFPIFFIALALAGSDSTIFLSAPFIIFSIFIFLSLMTVLLWLHRIIRFAVKSIDNIFHVRDRKHLKIKLLMEKINLIADDIEALQTRKVKYIKIIISSFFVRIFKYGSLYFLLHSVLTHLNYSFADLNFWKVFIGILGAEFSALLPLQGIAGIGTWESAWALTFKLLGHLDPQIAIVSGFGVHLITQLFEYSLGIISIVVLYLPFTKTGSLRTNWR